MKYTIELELDENSPAKFAKYVKLNGVNLDVNSFNVCLSLGMKIMDYANNLYLNSDEHINSLANHKRTEKVYAETFVYLMFDSNLNAYKIGHSKTPKIRETTLQAEKPTIEMLFYFSGTTKTEKDLHAKFAEKRMRGEWFKLDQSDINWIESNFETIKP